MELKARAFKRVTAPGLAPGVHGGATGRGDAEGPKIHLADLLLAAVLGGVALALYAVLALRLARGQYLDYYNLAFDFDPARYVSTFAQSPADPGNFKHPLILLLRPLAWPFLASGLDAKQASALVMVGFGGGSVAVCYLFLRVIRCGRTLASAEASVEDASGRTVAHAVSTMRIIAR